jgi:hypothetical protein
MGLFDKLKKPREASATDDGKIGVKGMPVNPAILGGPSTKALAADDPLLQPINGIGLPEYAAVARVCQQRGINNEDGMAQVAGELGHDPAVFKAAAAEWAKRMGQSMVVGQEFRRHLGY